MAMTHASIAETFSFPHPRPISTKIPSYKPNIYIYTLLTDQIETPVHPTTHITILIFIHNCISETVSVLSNPANFVFDHVSSLSIPRSFPRTRSNSINNCGMFLLLANYPPLCNSHGTIVFRMQPAKPLFSSTRPFRWTVRGPWQCSTGNITRYKLD